VGVKLALRAFQLLQNPKIPKGHLLCVVHQMLLTLICLIHFLVMGAKEFAFVCQLQLSFWDKVQENKKTQGKVGKNIQTKNKK